MVTRETRLVHAFVELADTLVKDFDLVDFLHLLTQRATELLEASEAGMLLADPDHTLHVMASSSEQTRALELFQLQTHDGPCLDCFRTGAPVIVEDLAAASDRWPRFGPKALSYGFASVHALPMRLREDVIGVLGLFGARPGRLSESDLTAGQGMADVATIGILHERAIHEAHLTVEQLQGALTSRVVIEQGKGVLAERGQISMDEAFKKLRDHARAHNRRLADVALDLIDGELAAATLLAARPIQSSRPAWD